MASISNEYQLQLILQTFEKDSQLSIYKVTRLYNIFYIILSIRINNVFIYINTMVNLRKLAALKEEVVV